MVQGYTKTAHMTWEGDGILRITLRKGAEIDVEEAAENFNLSNKLASNRKFLLLVRAEGEVSVTPEAREYSARHSASGGRIASAFITNSLAQRLVSNFYIRFHKPLTPVRMFSNEASALEWLSTYIPEIKSSWKSEKIGRIE